MLLNARQGEPEGRVCHGMRKIGTPTLGFVCFQTVILAIRKGDHVWDHHALFPQDCISRGGCTRNLFDPPIPYCRSGATLL